MRQFVISRCRQTWGIEYSVTDFKTKETVLCALHNGDWKSRVEAYGADGALKFTMKCRDLFGLTYDIVDADTNALGVLDRGNWLSSLLRVTDTRNEQTAQVVKVVPSLYEEFALNLHEQSICLFRKADSFSNPLICCCLDGSQLTLNLMLSAGILLLGQGPAENAGGTG